MFISKGWSDRVSGCYFTENSGILDKLFPGDRVILVDERNQCS